MPAKCPATCSVRDRDIPDAEMPPLTAFALRGIPGAKIPPLTLNSQFCGGRTLAGWPRQLASPGRGAARLTWRTCSCTCSHKRTAPSLPWLGQNREGAPCAALLLYGEPLHEMGLGQAQRLLRNRRLNMARAARANSVPSSRVTYVDDRPPLSQHSTTISRPASPQAVSDGHQRGCTQPHLSRRRLCTSALAVSHDGVRRCNME